jgi:LysR family hca operon transcriptional activator
MAAGRDARLREECPASRSPSQASIHRSLPRVRDRKLDAAFLRPEERYPDLVYKVLVREPLIVVLPSDHRLASQRQIGPERSLAGETFIGMADQAPVLRSIIEDYIRRSGVDLKPTQ